MCLFICKFAPAMLYTKYHWTELGVSLEMGTYEGRGTRERHAMLHVEPRGEGFAGQWLRLQQAQESLAAMCKGDQVVMKRYFVSDSTNQYPLIDDNSCCAINVIQQPLLDGSKVAVWIYMVEGVKPQREGADIVVRRGAYSHVWSMGMEHAEGDSAQQTHAVLEEYVQRLAHYDATMLRDCVRTWFYVRDVDTQYAGMVKARREMFEIQGLTPSTHYIASTGIQGLPAQTSSLIQLGAYAVTGLQEGQMHYVYALSHLNPTIEYGVTFERGTVVEYGDRAHCYISGTASIDNKGQVVHVGHIVEQTKRMWENVECLLSEGGFSCTDVAQMIVYLRDMADYDVVSHMFAERFPGVPVVFTLAPVCRPEWLIEMECVAIAPRENKDYQDF